MAKKIKELDSMTLSEIKKLKEKMEDEIREAIWAIEKKYKAKYEFGQLGVDTHTSFSDMEENPYLYVDVKFYYDEEEV